MASHTNAVEEMRVWRAIIIERPKGFKPKSESDTPRRLGLLDRIICGMTDQARAQREMEKYNRMSLRRNLSTWSVLVCDHELVELNTSALKVAEAAAENGVELSVHVGVIESYKGRYHFNVSLSDGGVQEDKPEFSLEWAIDRMQRQIDKLRANLAKKAKRRKRAVAK